MLQEINFKSINIIGLHTVIWQKIKNKYVDNTLKHTGYYIIMIYNVPLNNIIKYIYYFKEKITNDINYLK